MALRLGEILTKQGLITEEQLQHALRAQQHFGARLGTNLVEMGFVTEEQLAIALARQLNVDFVNSDEVAMVPPEIIAAVPKETAEKFRCVPTRMEGRELFVCMADPANLQSLDDLGFALGVPVKPQVITELALTYALERYYQIPRDARFLKLSGGEPGQLAVVRVAEADAPSGVSRAEFMNRETVKDVVGEKQNRPNGPGSLVELAAAADPLEVLNWLCRHLDPLFVKLMMLQMSPGNARGISQTGKDVFLDKIAGISANVTAGSLLDEIVQGIKISYHETVEDETVRQICLTAGIPLTQIALLPIVYNRQVRFVLIGHGVDAATLSNRTQNLRSMLGKISCAFQMVTLRREILGV